MGSYTKPQITYEKNTESMGKGLYAAVDINIGTVIGVFDGRAKALAIDPLKEYPNRDYWVELLLENGIMYYLDMLDDKVEGVELMNHSCVPNCIIDPFLIIRVSRKIQKDEELTLDYTPITKIKLGIQCTCRDGCATII
jgi:hypothetical protein